MAERLYDTILEEYPNLFSKDSKAQLTRWMLVDCATDDKTLDSDEFGTDKVVDIMLAYYEDIPEILTPIKVGGMDAEMLSELAAESEDTQSRRATLKKEVDILRNGLTQCRRYKPRGITSTPRDF
ncbi:hypothetical protein ACRE_087070 [Hapsidospora chrysogenum ATCC 11550]|uniref:GED domain-containing protein n=1 Tax=Hapsidospora chrysogenum (strain ATCC 11550 / CBS 779.69 / DSM 880 / IAM 14645 / JCM 23072 / IMI 49137) TaxID=857340 RepID=A0A086SU16_HAPC1|nr:hypothetical protein ACRE_087070 [Hapsidospora chrysogenum ATCC 11550]